MTNLETLWFFIKKTQVSTARIWNGTTGVPTAAGSSRATLVAYIKHGCTIHSPNAAAPYFSALRDHSWKRTGHVENRLRMIRHLLYDKSSLEDYNFPWWCAWNSFMKRTPEKRIEKASHESHDRREILIIIGFVYIQKFRQIFRVQQSPDKCHVILHSNSQQVT